MSKQFILPEKTIAKYQTKPQPKVEPAAGKVNIADNLILLGGRNPQVNQFSDSRFSAIQRQKVAGQIAKIHGNGNLQRRLSVQSLNKTKNHISASVLPEQNGHWVLRQSIKDAKDSSKEKSSPVSFKDKKVFNLGLYDYNVNHMIAWEDTVTKFLRQWEKFLSSGSGKGLWYRTLKKEGYLKPELKKAMPTAEVTDLAKRFAKEAQRNSFKRWATNWGKDFGADVFSVNEHKEAESKLEEAITSHSPAKLQNLALFGHGTGKSGWSGMGDVGKMLLKDKIKTGLATDLNLILYMCSTGEGGDKSFAAIVAGKLKKAGFTGPQIWAHTDAASAITNPHWKLFTDQNSGDKFFNTVFDDVFIKQEKTRLGEKYPNDFGALMERWFNGTGKPKATAKYITNAPMNPSKSIEELRKEWKKYIDAQVARKSSKKKK